MLSRLHDNIDNTRRTVDNTPDYKGDNTPATLLDHARCRASGSCKETER